MKTMSLSLRSLPLAALALFASLALAFADGAKTPAVGDKAPLFVGKDQNGNSWKLSGAVGKKIILLYFYPKDDTPGCTKEACGLRDRMSDLVKDNVTVVGVSFDDAASHQKFTSKFNLNFPLLADTDGKISDAYGTRVAPDKARSRRVSFLIGRDGVIKHITDVPSADTHLSEMKDAIARLAKK